MKLPNYFLLLGLIALAACGKNLEKQVRDQVRTIDGAELDKDSVEIISVRESGSHATAEIRINTAVKMTKKGDHWTLDEVRIGDRRWEKVERILQSLERQRADSTRQQMAVIRRGIDRYIERNGKAPQVSNYTALVDTLNPDFLPSVIRLDAWSNPYSFQVSATGGFELRSAGPDGTIGTTDDLILKQ